jgi:hypothetical protein
MTTAARFTLAFCLPVCRAAMSVTQNTTLQNFGKTARVAARAFQNQEAMHL